MPLDATLPKVITYSCAHMSVAIIVRASGVGSATIAATLIRRIRPFVVEKKIFVWIYSMVRHVFTKL